MLVRWRGGRAVLAFEKNKAGGVEMLGDSPVFRRAVALIERMARFDAPVLIEGETGTGKELAARALHYMSARRDRPFVPVNCGAIPDSLFENELFGHRRGAFTDAREDAPGLVALAHGGTLFLDEVDALTAKGQVSLLRFLQDRQFRPLGARSTQSADVRIIAASNAGLATLTEAGRFRADLLYRLNIMFVLMPPLRERVGDPELLARHFVREAGRRYGAPAKPLHPDTVQWLGRHAWPGNVRELENLVYRELLLSEGSELRFAGERPSGEERRTSPDRRGNTFDDQTYREARARTLMYFESRYVSSVLGRARGNVTAAAKLAGKERRAFGRLVKKHGIDRSRF